MYPSKFRRFRLGNLLGSIYTQGPIIKYSPKQLSFFAVLKHLFLISLASTIQQ